MCGPYFDVELHCFTLSQAAEAISLDACLQASENLVSAYYWWATVKQPASVASKVCRDGPGGRRGPRHHRQGR